jgi:hypothetical protein
MSFETSGADYLRRLKRDQEQQPQTYVEAAPAPAPAEPEKQERRRNPRYKCEGSATFRVRGGNMRSWGTFTDLSISGCYVELKATFPLGALLDLELELNGVRAQVKGEVRVRCRKSNSSGCCARARGFKLWLLAFGFWLLAFGFWLPPLRPRALLDRSV